MSRPLHLLSNQAEPYLRVLVDAGFRVQVSPSPSVVEAAACVVVDARHVAPNDLPQLRVPFVVVSSERTPDTIRAWVEAGAKDVIGWPSSARELAVRLHAVILGKRKVACIGGGTGLFNLLRGLKTHADVQLTSIVAMADDGGSSGRLRAELGVLPPGDIRRSLVALSDAPELMNEVMQFRFSSGEGIAGHSLGNLVLTALSELRGDFSEAVRGLADILHIRGIVTCSTIIDTRLCAELENGDVIRGESAIDRGEGRDPAIRIRRVWLEPAAPCSLDAIVAVSTADIVLIGPGDLYTSIVANLVVDGMAEALRRTSARVVYIANLMTKPGETFGFTMADHVEAIVKHVGADVLDDVIVSRTVLDPSSVARYEAEGQVPVRGDIRPASSASLVEADVSDPKHLVRHDPEKLADAIRTLDGPRGPATTDLRPQNFA